MIEIGIADIVWLCDGRPRIKGAMGGAWDRIVEGARIVSSFGLFGFTFVFGFVGSFGGG